MILDQSRTHLIFEVNAYTDTDAWLWILQLKSVWSSQVSTPTSTLTLGVTVNRPLNSNGTLRNLFLSILEWSWLTPWDKTGYWPSLSRLFPTHARYHFPCLTHVVFTLISDVKTVKRFDRPLEDYSPWHGEICTQRNSKHHSSYRVYISTSCRYHGDCTLKVVQINYDVSTNRQQLKRIYAAMKRWIIGLWIN